MSGETTDDAFRHIEGKVGELRARATSAEAEVTRLRGIIEEAKEQTATAQDETAGKWFYHSRLRIADDLLSRVDEERK